MSINNIDQEGKKGGEARAQPLQGQTSFNWKYFLWGIFGLFLFVWFIGAMVNNDSDEAGITTVETPAAESTPDVREYPVQREVGFETERRGDPNLPKGEERVLEQGQKGVIEITYRVETIDGEEQPREEVKRRVIRPALRRVVLVGTYEAPKAQAAASDDNCTPGYSPCLPPMSDYDCSNGSGDGPGYTGTVRVTGSDPYGLDRDGDGIGCDWG